MSGPDDALDDVDLAILDQLGDLLDRVDPPPSDLDDRVRFALTVRALHAEVAELTSGEAVAVRGADESVATDSVTFTAGSLSLMVSTQVDDDGDTCRVDGWVTRGGAIVDAVAGAATVSATADDTGRFVLEGVPRGSVYFVVRTSGSARPVVTPSLEV